MLESTLKEIVEHGRSTKTSREHYIDEKEECE
jgi:hypothetical protein